MQQQNLRQISDLLDQKFEKNNKKIFKKIDDKIDELAIITKDEFDRVDKKFDKMDKRFDKMDKELEKKPDKSEISTWADNKIIPLQLDMDKTKYIHRNEWKKLPPAYEIKKTLIENGIA